MGGGEREFVSVIYMYRPQMLTGHPHTCLIWVIEMCVMSDCSQDDIDVCYVCVTEARVE